MISSLLKLISFLTLATTTQILYAQDESINPSVAPVVDQLAAYNNHDIDAFLVPFADSIKVYNFGGQLQYTGKEIMRQRYAGFFERTPDLHCKLVNRIVMGNTIIDHEEITTDKNKPTWQAVAIYKVRDGLIQSVTFVKDN